MEAQNVNKFKIELQFMGHYKEPNLDIKYTRSADPTVYELNYDPRYRKWDVNIVPS